jgi:PIN domain nuclease of toxin-antitoxin system
MAERGLLLDTHVWIWAAEGLERQLSRRAIRAIEHARAAGQIYVSAVSVREVVLLAERGRLTLSMPADAWARRALAVSGVHALVLDPEAAALSARLPPSAPRDPADQMLIATAMLYGLTLVTRDEAILKYGSEAGMVVMSA